VKQTRSLLRHIKTRQYAFLVHMMQKQILNTSLWLHNWHVQWKTPWFGGSLWWHCRLASNNSTLHVMKQSAQTKKNGKHVSGKQL